MGKGVSGLLMILLILGITLRVENTEAAELNAARMQAAQQATGAPAQAPLSPQAQAQLIKKIQSALIKLPYTGVYDNLAFRLEGRTVILEGQVTNPVNKPDAETAVKRIEGVEKVVNNIEALPPSPMDDRLRRAVYHAIYDYGPLFKYKNVRVNPPIRIIVKNSRVTLEGVVDNENDKNLCTIRANQVPGALSVTNNLRVVKS